MLQPVAGMAVVVLLCWPVAAQAPPQGGAGVPGPKVRSEVPNLPNAPSSARAGQAAKAASEPPPSSQATGNSIPYQPLSNGQKFHRFIRTTVSPYTFVSASLNATWLQINGEPYAYGGGMSGWGMRFGTRLADTEVRSFFSQFFFPVILNQDPRYFPKRQGNIFDRGWYAATRVLVVRADSGNPQFNTSYLLGVAFSRAASTAYIPEDQRNLGDTMLSIVGAYGSDAGSYVLQEFWPDIVRVFRRHAPHSMVDIEKKIPPQLMGGPTEPDDKKSDGSGAACSGGNKSGGSDSDCSGGKKSGSDSGHSPSRKADCAPGGHCDP